MHEIDSWSTLGIDEMCIRDRIYRATRRFYQECKERKEHKRISSNSVLEYLKCSESLECLNDIKIETEHARLTAECVPSTEIQRAEWRGRNEMVDRAIRIIDSRIEYEKRKADKRAELK